MGLRRVFGGVGTLLGPLWAGGLLNHMYIMMGVNLALTTMGCVSTFSIIIKINHSYLWYQVKININQEICISNQKCSIMQKLIRKLYGAYL